MTDQSNDEMQQLIRDMLIECKREEVAIAELRDYVDKIGKRLESGTMPTLKETEILLNMRKAVINNLSVLEAVKVNSNLQPKVR